MEGVPMTTHQFSSRTPLAHQQLLRDRPLPGPGQYETVSEFEQSAMIAKSRGAALAGTTQFGTSSDRVGWSRPLNMPYAEPYNVNVPGPGMYTEGEGKISEKKLKNDVEKVLGIKKKVYGVHHPMIMMALQDAQGPWQAFNSTDDRDCNKVAVQSTPAPGQYNKEQARGHSLSAVLRERAKVGKRGVFGTCADRFFGSPLAGREDLPDPEGVDELSRKAHSEPRAFFQSSTPRIPVHLSREPNVTKVGSGATPAPGSYSVDREPNYRSPYRHPKTDHLSFGSGNRRFVRDIFEGHVNHPENPGPGFYNQEECGSARGSAPLSEPRELSRPVGCTSESVGPGTYGADSTMLKKSFNVSTSGMKPGAAKSHPGSSS